MKNPAKSGMGVWDLHHRQHDEKLWKNILKLVKVIKPHYFVLGGDNMNMDAVDHWLQDKGDRRHLEGKRLKQDYLDFQSEILNPLERELPGDCEMIWLDGNHEDWVNKYVDKIPELEGFVEIEKNINLSRWRRYEYGKCAKIGKLYFHHGEYTTQYHAAKMVRSYKRTICYGHSHSLQLFTDVSPIDSNPQFAVQIPCACKMNPRYMKNRSNSWVNGFMVFYMQENGNFNLYPVVASKHHFIFNGIYY